MTQFGVPISILNTPLNRLNVAYNIIKMAEYRIRKLGYELVVSSQPVIYDYITIALLSRLM